MTNLLKTCSSTDKFICQLNRFLIILNLLICYQAFALYSSNHLFNRIYGTYLQCCKTNQNVNFPYKSKLSN